MFDGRTKFTRGNIPTPLTTVTYSSDESIHSIVTLVKAKLTELNYDVSKYWIGGLNGTYTATETLTDKVLGTLTPLVAMKRTGYSEIEFATAKDLVHFRSEMTSDMTCFNAATITREFQDSIEQFEADLQDETHALYEKRNELDVMVQTAQIHLGYLRRSFSLPSCYNEATRRRRQIIDPIRSLCICIHWFAYFLVEASVMLEDATTEDINYIGDG